MAKGVLGNDPFQRGAESRAGDGGKQSTDDTGAKPANKGAAATGGCSISPSRPWWSWSSTNPSTRCFVVRRAAFR
jgi:hypothetical protein